MVRSVRFALFAGLFVACMTAGCAGSYPVSNAPGREYPSYPVTRVLEREPTIDGRWQVDYPRMESSEGEVLAVLTHTHAKATIVFEIVDANARNLGDVAEDRAWDMTDDMEAYFNDLTKCKEGHSTCSLLGVLLPNTYVGMIARNIPGSSKKVFLCTGSWHRDHNDVIQPQFKRLCEQFAPDHLQFVPPPPSDLPLRIPGG